MYVQYKNETYLNISHYLQADIILIVTATDIETSATHNKLYPITGENEIIKFFHEAQTYYFGLFGAYKAVHVQCGMGSNSRDSSITTVKDAIHFIKPSVVLMPGIAFGINSTSQKVGDVIVAKTIYPYNNNRIGVNVIDRGTSLNANKLLVNRFENIKATWNYPLKEGLQASLLIEPILSGEELIDNEVYRDKLVNRYPTVRGGDMEGYGLYSACDGSTPCILVKGICDFADGNKSINKDENQKIAVNSALSACLEVFRSNCAFETIGLNPFSQQITQSVNYRKNGYKIIIVSVSLIVIALLILLTFNKSRYSKIIDNKSESGYILPSTQINTKNLYFFGRDDNGDMIYNSVALNGVSFKGWTKLGFNTSTNSTPGIYVTGDNVYIARRDNIDGSVWFNQTVFPNPFKKNWDSMGIKTDVDPAVAVMGNRIYVFVKKLNGKIAYKQIQSGLSTSEWIEIDGNYKTNESLAAGVVNNEVFVVLKDTNNELYLNHTLLATPFIPTWTKMNIKTDVAPVVAVLNEKIYFFKDSATHILYRLGTLNGSISNWTEINNNTKTKERLYAGVGGEYVLVQIKGLDGINYYNLASKEREFGKDFTVIPEDKNSMK